MADPRSMKARKERADARKDIMSKPAIRNALQAAAKKNNTSIGKSAVDNFVNTYKNTKVGPIQRAIANFFKPSKPGGSYLKPGTKPDRDRKAQANRAKSQGGRTFAQAAAAGSPPAKKPKQLNIDAAQKSAAAKRKAVAAMSTKPKPKAQPKAKTFKQAFAEARKKGVGTKFTFKGKDGKTRSFVAVRSSDIPKSITGTSAERLRKFLNMRKGKK